MPVATDLLPTPAGTPPPQEAKPDISVEINIATRKQHAELNRLIIHRLPLALPPHATSPGRYAVGITAFTNIYAAFEASFSDLSGLGEESKKSSAHELEIAKWLCRLRPPGLARTRHLLHDKEHTGFPRDKLFHYKNQEIYQRVQGLCNEKPHTLVAYTWVMYMAIFSGGRWIRQQLANAGPEFWNGSSATEKSSGFEFLSFPDSDEDGEDIKQEYKARLVAGEHLLTSQERQDVLDAAVDLFEMCIALVGSLDKEVDEQEKSRVLVKGRDRSAPRLVSLLVFSVCLLCLWKIAVPTLRLFNE